MQDATFDDNNHFVKSNTTHMNTMPESYVKGRGPGMYSLYDWSLS